LEQRFVGHPAGLAIDHFKVGFDDLEPHVEWADTLSAVSFEVKKGNHTERVFLWLSGASLLSHKRQWDYEAIRKAQVRKITAELCFD
jgi:hypothetical protein